MTPKILRMCLLFAKQIDRTSVIVGQTVSYLVIASILLITFSVVMRYFFSRTYVALDEIQYYFYSTMFLFGFSYVYKENGHIKVDILNARLSEKAKRWINLLGTLFLTIPWAAAVSYYTFKYFQRSYAVFERSPQANGLPALYILKFILFLGFVLLLLQAVAKAIHLISEFSQEQSG